MMFQTFDSLRCLGAAIKFISCTVNLFSLSMEEVTNVHKIEVQVITSRSESILTALPCAGVLWELLFLWPVLKIMKTSQVMKLINPKRIFASVYLFLMWCWHRGPAVSHPVTHFWKGMGIGSHCPSLLERNELLCLDWTRDCAEVLAVCTDCIPHLSLVLFSCWHCHSSPLISGKLAEKGTCL